MTDDIPPVPVSPVDGEPTVNINDLEARAKELQESEDMPVGESWKQALTEGIEAVEEYES